MIREKLLLKVATFVERQIVWPLREAEAALRTRRMLKQFPIGSFVKLHIACEKLGQVTAQFERDEMQGVWIVRKYITDEDRFSLERPHDGRPHGKAWTHVGSVCLSRAPR